MSHIRLPLTRTKNKLTGTLSTLAYALEHSDDADLEEYLLKWGDSIAEDLSAAKWELSQALAKLPAIKRNKES